MIRCINTLLILLLLLLPVGVKSQNGFELQAVNPIEKNLSPEKLDSLGQFLEDAGSSSLMILIDGKVAFSWGDTEKKITVHSIRKALLNSLYGIYIANGTIDTTKSLKDLGIDDIEPALTEAEKSATIADLLRSRSGVYHPAAAVSEGMLRSMPPRESHQPGEAFYYNNWDFNTLGHILEQETGESIYELFYKDIAQPLGMDFGRNYITATDPPDDWQIPEVDGFYQVESKKSKYPAFHFRLSAEDLARYGQLYLNNGKWQGRQIIPEEWIVVSTRPYSVTNESYGIAYGMLWFVLYPTEDRPSKSFYHTGTGVHMLGVYPSSNLVLIHRVDTEKAYKFHEGNFYEMISRVWGSFDR